MSSLKMNTPWNSTITTIVRKIGAITISDLLSFRFYLRCIYKTVKILRALWHKKDNQKNAIIKKTDTGTAIVVIKNLLHKKHRIVVSTYCLTAGIVVALKILFPGYEINALPIYWWNLKTDEIKRLTMLLEEADVWVTAYHSNLLTELGIANVQLIRIPGLLFRAFHPDIVYARKKSNGQLISQTEHFNSLLVLWAWLQGFSVEMTKDLFSERTFLKLGWLDLWTTSVETMKEAFSRTDIDFNTFFLRAKRYGIFMHSLNHPIQPAVSHLAWQVAGLIDQRKSAVDSSILELIPDPLCRTIWPVYPPIAEALSLNGSYIWRLNNEYYPNLDSFIEHSFSIYRKETVTPDDIVFEGFPTDGIVNKLNEEYGRRC
jgi:hypothetical protein